MDQINSDMRLAEEALKSMDLLCGIFPKFWKKSGGFKEDDAIWGDQKVRAMHFYILQLFVSIHSLAKNKITLLDTYRFSPNSHTFSIHIVNVIPMGLHTDVCCSEGTKYLPS